MLLMRDIAYENSNELAYAPFWARLLAFVIDIVLVLGCLTFSRILSIAPELTNMLFPNQSIADFFLSIQIFVLAFLLLTFWLYFSVMESSKIQATVGKLIVGIKVVDLFGDRIRFGKACGRFFLNLVSLLLFGAGHAFALFTGRSQSIQDQLTDSEVVKGRADFFVAGPVEENEW